MPRARGSSRDAWRIDGALGSFPGNDDAKAFADWARATSSAAPTEQHTDGARLADVVAPLLAEGALRKPKLLVAYAFDVVDAAGAGLPRCLREGGDRGRDVFRPIAAWPAARTVRVFASAQDGARGGGAVGAREAGSRRRAHRRRRARARPAQRRRCCASSRARCIRRTTCRARGAQGAAVQRLARRAAFGLSARAARRFPDWSSRQARCRSTGVEADPLVPSSPARTPRWRRARCSMPRFGESRRRNSASASSSALIEGCPLLRQALEALFAVREAGDEIRRTTGPGTSPTLLEAVGFPGERALDSDEFQTRAKLNETLAELAQARARRAADDARRARWRSFGACARDTLFQPESPDGADPGARRARVGGPRVRRAVGERPHRRGLAAARRAQSFPSARAAEEGAAFRKRRRKRRWRARGGSPRDGCDAADEVVVSHPAREDDRKLIASPLISGVPAVLERRRQAPSHGTAT